MCGRVWQTGEKHPALKNTKIQKVLWFNRHLANSTEPPSRCWLLVTGRWGEREVCKIYRIVNNILRNHRTSLAVCYADSRLREIQRSKDASWHSSHWVSLVDDGG